MMLLLLNTFCNGFDVTANSPNFFCQSIELFQKFEARLQIPVNEQGIDRLSSLNYDMQRMLKALHSQCDVSKLESRSIKLSAESLLLSQTQSKSEMLNKNYKYFSKISPYLVKDWQSLEKTDKDKLAKVNDLQFEPYQKLYAQMINTEKNKKHLQTLRKFAVYFELVKDFHTLMGHLEVSTSDDYANYYVCTVS
jgi:hypothetical protein